MYTPICLNLAVTHYTSPKAAAGIDSLPCAPTFTQTVAWYIKCCSIVSGLHDRTNTPERPEGAM